MLFALCDPMLSLADNGVGEEHSRGGGNVLTALPHTHSPQGLDFAILHTTTRVTQATRFKAPLGNRQQVSALKFGV